MNELPILTALEQKNISTELTGTDLDFPCQDGRGGVLMRTEGPRPETSLTTLEAALAHLDMGVNLFRHRCRRRCPG